MYKKAETGRTVTEIIVVLAIIALLSISGIVAYISVFQKQQVRHLTDEMSKRVAILDLEIGHLQQSKTTEKVNAILAQNSVVVRGYRLDFHVAPGTEKGFITDVTRVDGKPIKGAMCRELIRKMSEQQYVSDVDFTVHDQELDDGTTGDVNVRLNGKIVNMDALCG